MSARPYTQTSFPNENPIFSAKPLLGINQLNFAASSNYNSLQATLRQAVWHGIQGTLNYTYGKSLDDSSTNTTPMNSYNLHQDYGPSTFDNRHLLNGFVYYNAPTSARPTSSRTAPTSMRRSTPTPACISQPTPRAAASTAG
jgi:hypothetical protein